MKEREEERSNDKEGRKEAGRNERGSERRMDVRQERTKGRGEGMKEIIKDGKKEKPDRTLKTCASLVRRKRGVGMQGWVQGWSDEHGFKRQSAPAPFQYP